MGADFDRISALEGVTPAFVEALYDQYLADPFSVDQTWARYFEDLEAGVRKAGPSWGRSDWPLKPEDDRFKSLDAGDMFIEADKPKAKADGSGLSAADVRAATIDSIRALMLVRTYRVRGHLMAYLDPLGREERPLHPELAPETYGFGTKDMGRKIFMDGVLGLETATLAEIIAILKRTYCGNIGVEFMHINDPEEKAWIQRNIEGRDKEIHFT